MFSDRSTLHHFLLERGKGERGRVRADLALLEPFFRKADAAEYDVSHASRVEPQKAAEAIAEATGADIERVDFLSLRTGPSPLRGDAAVAFWESQVRELSADVKSLLWRRNTGAMEEGFGGEKNVLEFHDLIWQTIGEPLWHSFEQNRWESTGHKLRLIVRANLLEAVKQFSAFMLLGAEERLVSLRPLMRLMAEAMPIGARNGNDAVWACITA
ncbi:MAG TPA: hypothetical protein VL426_00390 [Candidatus Binatia bacterium]|jgi:hypothetical protein|nr:hypothetical protein [Candidatus Binatia bacterium]